MQGFAARTLELEVRGGSLCNKAKHAFCIWCAAPEKSKVFGIQDMDVFNNLPWLNKQRKWSMCDDDDDDDDDGWFLMGSTVLEFVNCYKAELSSISARK